MDTFFGFNTKLPVELDDGEEDEEFARKFYSQTTTRRTGLRSPLHRRCTEDISDEEEYDALNDETFGAAVKGDWEDIHETLVRLERGRSASIPGDDDDDASSGDLLFDDYDFDLQLSKLTQCDDTNDESGRSSAVAQSIGDEFASKLRLDPSIWGTPFQEAPPPPLASSPQQPQYYDRKSSVTPFAQSNAFYHATGEQNAARPTEVFPAMKIRSLEDIERNIIHNQHQQNQHQQSFHLLQKQMAQQQQQQQLQQQRLMQPFLQSTAPVHGHQQPVVKPREHIIPTKEAKTIPSLPMHSSPGVGPALMTPPPHLLAARNCALFPSGPPPQPPQPPVPPLLNHSNRLPLGLLPYNILTARPYSAPINNLAMHPAFPPHGPYGSPLQGFLHPPPPVKIGQPLPQRHPGLPGPPFLLQHNPTPHPNNQFNQRLMQEIQQNHPILAFNRQLLNSFNACGNGMKMHVPQNLPRPALGTQLQYPPQQQQRSRQAAGTGIPPGAGPERERDEYANMMSNRDKQWLIGIQLSQLNSDVPYWNDYYFTVFKQRLAEAKADVEENHIYVENKQSHPFSNTPTKKEHAHLLLLSMLTRNVKVAGMMNRERLRLAVTMEKMAATARPYTPFQFEKSLGKLQCGSVTAPRKLIDADVMAGDQLNGNGGITAAEQSLTQRKARHVLLLIETLYNLLLKLEDKLNPIAIATAKVLREKQLRDHANMVGTAYSNGGCPGKLENFKANGVTNGCNNGLEPEESFDELCECLLGQLSQEKVTSILGVRKGRNLLRRTLGVLHNRPSRWTLWNMIFTALPCLAKKDRDDADCLVLALYGEFERQLRHGTVEDLLLVATSISSSRKVMQCIVGSKFLLSCIITIIFQMEMFCGKHPASLLTVSQANHQWVTFLLDVNQVVKESAVGPRAGGSISINPDDNILRTLRVHFARFGTRVDGTDLLNFIIDYGNGQQKNRTALICSPSTSILSRFRI
uniref:mRNA decay factor PAT1 domain-containing protein n=1 Tax=Anopheles stephensi TaxID=30069 RepID=A0A182Y8C9_ANOST